MSNIIKYKSRDNILLKSIQDVLERYSKMDDIKEIVIVSKTKENTLRYYICNHEDSIWWMGALTDVISWFRDRLYFLKDEEEI